eukprot:symbB.v1.2.027858.t2/scaffold2872.1/size68408/9
MAMEAFSKAKGSSSSKQIKVPEAAALDVKLEKAHKQLQKETMEQLEKARKEKAERARLESEKAAREAKEKEAKVKAEKTQLQSKAKAPEKTPEKPEKRPKTDGEKAVKAKSEKAEKAEKAEIKMEKKDVKIDKADKVKHEKSDKEKKVKKDKKEKKHKKDKKHKKHKHRHNKSEMAGNMEGKGREGAKNPQRLSASRIRELLRSKVLGKDKTKVKLKELKEVSQSPAARKYPYHKNEEGLYIRSDYHERPGYSSKYMGVSSAPSQKDPNRISWRVQYDGYVVGKFENEEDAARAYAKARDEAEGIKGGKPQKMDIHMSWIDFF